MYPECFYGIGKFKDYEYHITLEDNAKPVIHPPRKTPLALQPKLHKEFDEMVEQGIITPGNGPSALVNALMSLADILQAAQCLSLLHLPSSSNLQRSYMQYTS